MSREMPERRVSRPYRTSEAINTLSTVDIIKKYGGWNEGHFVFRTGEHGNGWIDKMGFLRYPEVMTEMGKRLANQYADMKDQIDVVVGPSIIGTIIACAAAAELGVPFTATYRTKNDNEVHFHRGFVPQSGTRCLLVDDFVFSGTDLMDNIRFMQSSGLDVIGASVIGQRQDIETPVPLRSLIRVPFIKWSAEDCPLTQPITATNIRE